MSSLNMYTLTEESKFNRFHGIILFWCVLILIIDGYDLAVVGLPYRPSWPICKLTQPAPG